MIIETSASIELMSESNRGETGHTLHLRFGDGPASGEFISLRVSKEQFAASRIGGAVSVAFEVLE